MTTTSIESLRTFAEQHGEIEFAHLCTAALHRDEASWDAARADASSATGHAVGCDCTTCALIREESVYVADAWAVERLTEARFRMDGSLDRPAILNDWALKVIRTTDTTRPDGAIARSVEV